MGLYDVIILQNPFKFKYFKEVKEFQTKYYTMYKNGRLYLEAHTSLTPKENVDLSEFIKGGWLSLYFRIYKVKNLRVEPMLRTFKEEPFKIKIDMEDIEIFHEPSFASMEITFYDRKGKRYTVRTREPILVLLQPRRKLLEIEEELINKVREILNYKSL